MSETILKLTNNKGRVVYQAEQESDCISTKHENGGGISYKPEDCFMMAHCTWSDNPSCKIEGTHRTEFLSYVEQKMDWFPFLKKYFDKEKTR